MTEPLEDGQDLVRVRAQVMTRDDVSGGWIPLGGGGLSNVSVRKRTPDKNPDIYGRRISDGQAVLSCTIKKDFEYNRVMPTFHHWKTGEKKFGLTFQTAADARAFSRAVVEISQKILKQTEPVEVFLTSSISSSNEQRKHGAFGNFIDDMEYICKDGPEFTSLRKYPTDIGDDDVFMTLDLPVERDSSSSSTTSATGSHNQSHQYPPSHLHLHRMYFASRTCTKDSSCFKDMYSVSSKDKMSDIMCCERDLQLLKDDEQYSSYVQFARERPHEYSYPIVQPDSSSNLNKLNDFRLSNCTSSSVICQPKKPVQLDPLSLQPPPLLPTKSSSGSSKKKRGYGKKQRCRDCHEMYSENSNPRGCCQAGPDIVITTIDGVSCLSVANAFSYHCFADSEGQVPTNHRCVRRWIAMGLLSILFPCLCLYLPLTACHNLGRRCKLCGPKHRKS